MNPLQGIHPGWVGNKKAASPRSKALETRLAVLSEFFEDLPPFMDEKMGWASQLFTFQNMPLGGWRDLKPHKTFLFLQIIL
jgi:hypothetical protein